MALVGAPYHHNVKDLRLGLMRILEAVKVPNVHIWYLHSPGRTAPFGEALREVSKLYHEKLGTSNYRFWEVAMPCDISKKNRYDQAQRLLSSKKMPSAELSSQSFALLSTLRYHNLLLQPTCCGHVDQSLFM